MQVMNAGGVVQGNLDWSKKVLGEGLGDKRDAGTIERGGKS